MIILDSSATVEYLTEPAAIGEWVRTTIETEREIAAPHIVDLEVVSAIRKKLLRRDLTRRAAEEALESFHDLALTRYPVTDLLSRVWELRAVLTPYDAAYVALAEVLQSALVTTDARLARSHGHRARIVTFASA